MEFRRLQRLTYKKIKERSRRKLIKLREDVRECGESSHRFQFILSELEDGNEVGNYSIHSISDYPENDVLNIQNDNEDVGNIHSNSDNLDDHVGDNNANNSEVDDNDDDNSNSSNDDEDNNNSNSSNDDGDDDNSDNSDVEADRVPINFNNNNNVCNESDDEELLRQWAIRRKIPHSDLNELLEIIRRKWSPNLPKSARTFLGTSSATYSIIPMQDGNESFGEFVYVGIVKNLIQCVNINVQRDQTLKLLINVDGMQLFKSSSRSFWPILGLIMSNDVQYEPFVIALYSGMSKPKYSHQYFRQFVIELNEILTNGAIISGIRFNIQLEGFVCDTLARAYIKSTVGHTAFKACERCCITGVKVEKTTVYSVSHINLRTDESFRNFEDPSHHVGVSPLVCIDPPIDMISSFFIDFMHLGFLGVTKKILELLLTGQRAKLSQTSKTEISRRLESIKLQIPVEFPRKCRSLKDQNKYKATEYKLILLYLGVVVFKDILPDEEYKHFTLLCIGSRLLWSSHTAIANVQLAKEYFQRFASQLSSLYGPKACVLNIHHLTHIADDVANTGYALNEVSSFPFENYMTQLKSMIRSPNRPLAQFCRRLHESTYYQQPAPIKRNLMILKRKETNILKLHYKKMILSTKPPNNTIILHNNMILQIEKMFFSNKSVMIEGKKLQIKDSIFYEPKDSSELKMWEIKNRSSLDMHHVNITEVAYKAIRLDLALEKDGMSRIFVLSLLHE